MVPAAFAAVATTLIPCTHPDSMSGQDWGRISKTRMQVVHTLRLYHPFIHSAGTEVALALEGEHHAADALHTLGHRLRICSIALQANISVPVVWPEGMSSWQRTHMR